MNIILKNIKYYEFTPGFIKNLNSKHTLNRILQRLFMHVVKTTELVNCELVGVEPDGTDDLNFEVQYDYQDVVA